MLTFTVNLWEFALVNVWEWTMLEERGIPLLIWWHYNRVFLESFHIYIHTGTHTHIYIYISRYNNFKMCCYYNRKSTLCNCMCKSVTINFLGVLFILLINIQLNNSSFTYKSVLIDCIHLFDTLTIHLIELNSVFIWYIS